MGVLSEVLEEQWGERGEMGKWGETGGREENIGEHVSALLHKHVAYGCLWFMQLKARAAKKA